MTGPHAFSYRRDPNVADFEDTAPVAVMDGHCALCSFGARMISRFDTSGSIRICPAQTDLGRALLKHFDMDPADPESWLFLENGKAWTSFDAWIRAGECCKGAGRLMSIFWVAPKPVRNWIYRRVARNRYALFGRADLCELPDPRLRARLIGTR